jgi:hypothetical protein
MLTLDRPVVGIAVLAQFVGRERLIGWASNSARIVRSIRPGPRLIGP